MLAFLRIRSVRHALVIMLMILSALIVVERAQAIINGVQHGLALEHSAPALELAAADHDHDHDAGDRLTDVDDQDHAPGPHHHHSEPPPVAALTSPVTVVAAVSRSVAVFTRADAGSPQSRIFGLERPPKALSDRA